MSNRLNVQDMKTLETFFSTILRRVCMHFFTLKTTNMRRWPKVS
jgi:hypothetical protein